MDEMFFNHQLSSSSGPSNSAPQDNISDYAFPMDSMGSGGQQGKLLATDKNDNSTPSYDDDKKKLMHRDIERQRRQEMATRCASLRNLLPLEYIKGKRAISDHMNGAVTYIKDLQKRIDELSVKRDELKKLSNSSGFEQGMSSSNESFPNSAVVRQSLEGIEVVISTSLGDKALTLSRVLKLLLDYGLDVFSCISARINGGVIHTIQSEVSDLTRVDIPGLEETLNDEISSLSHNIHS